MNAILYIESASGKLIPKLSTRAQATLGFIMTFIKRAHSGGKFDNGLCTRAHSVRKFDNGLCTRAHSVRKFDNGLCTHAHSVRKFDNGLCTHAHSVRKFDNGMCTRAHSVRKVAIAYFTFFSTTKFSSFLNSNTIVS